MRGVLVAVVLLAGCFGQPPSGPGEGVPEHVVLTSAGQQWDVSFHREDAVRPDGVRVDSLVGRMANSEYLAAFFYDEPWIPFATQLASNDGAYIWSAVDPAKPSDVSGNPLSMLWLADYEGPLKTLEGNVTVSQEGNTILRGEHEIIIEWMPDYRFPAKVIVDGQVVTEANQATGRVKPPSTSPPWTVHPTTPADPWPAPSGKEFSFRDALDAAAFLDAELSAFLQQDALMLAVAEYASHEPTPASPLGSAAWAIAVSSPEETYDFTVLSTGPVTPTYQFQSVHRDDPKPTQHFADRVETPLVSFAFMEETCGVAYYVDDGTPWFSCDPGGELGFPEDVRDARTGYMSRQIRLP